MSIEKSLMAHRLETSQTQHSVNKLQLDGDVINSSVAAVRREVGSLSTSVGQMQGDLASIPAIRTCVDSLMQDVTALQSGFDNTGQDANIIRNELGDMQVDLDAIQSGISGLDSHVQNIQSGIEATDQSTKEIHETLADQIADAAKQQAILRHRKIIRWLSTTDPSLNFYAALKKREPTTGRWPIGHEDFQKWKGKHGSLLWVTGIRKLTMFQILLNILTGTSWVW